MLSVDRCRHILGDEVADSADDLERIRDALYQLANIAVDAYRKESRGKPVRGLKAIGDQLVPDLGADIEERAAIQEFEGGMDRDAAERDALGEYLRRLRQ